MLVCDVSACARRYFDANGDGVLQVSECEAALAFLAGKGTAVAMPAGKGPEQAVTKLDFWLMFKAMMGIAPPPPKSALEAAADALKAAGFKGTPEEMEWLRQRVCVRVE